MKIVLDPSLYTFDPVTAGTLDFSAFSAFDQTRLLAVINTDYNGGELIYNTAGQGVTGGTFSGSVLTFIYPVVGSGMTASDNLCVLYESDTAVQSVQNTTTSFSSTTVTGTPNNAILNSANGYDASPWGTGIFQITNLSGSATMIFEGSNDNSTWYAIPAREVNSTNTIIGGAASWTPANGAIACAQVTSRYIRLRVTSNTGSFVCNSFMMAGQYASPMAYNILLNDAGRNLHYGSGSSSSQTLRVIPASDSTITLPDLMIAGPAQTSTVNNALTGTAAATDVLNYRSFSLHVVGTASVTGGQFIVEQSNDNTNWQNVVYYGTASTTPSAIAGANNVSSSFNQIYSGIITTRYFRVRISSAITGTSASITVTARFSPTTALAPITPITGTVSGNLGILSSTFNDFSGSITTTTTNTITTPNIGTFAIGVQVTSVFTTNPVCDIRIEETFDSGTNWTPLYYFERITANGIYYSPPLRASGTGIRYIRTVSGSGGSFTMTGVRIARTTTSSIVKNLMDRTLNVNGLNSTSSLLTEGMEKFQLTVSSGAGASVNPVIQLQGSEDNSSWYNLSGMSVTATPSAVVTVASPATPEMPKFIRATVTTQGTGATLNYLIIKGIGRP